MIRKSLVSAAVAAAALGCGGVAIAKSPVPGKPGNQAIVDIALGANKAGEFEYLVGAASCSYFDGAVVKLLSGGTYTLFAPTDAAFRKLLKVPQPAANAPEPKGEKFPCDAFKDNPAVLLDILTYHVTDGRRFSNSVFNRNSAKMIEMLNGQYVVSNPNLTLTDNKGQSVRVVAPFNVNASNGVIHAIDTVLLP